MTFESAEIESSRAVTPKIKGKRAAKRNQAYFNPYSKHTQKQSYMDFEAGWNEGQAVHSPDKVVKDNLSPATIVLVLGIMLVALMYFVYHSQ